MIKKLLLLCVSCLFYYQFFAQTTSMRVFDAVLFYDGYDPKIYDSALNDGILRHSNSLYATKLTSEQLASFGNQITMQVTVKASCDNYDRIGNVNLAFVNKGDTIYKPDSVQRIEIGRFITPFMDKNKQPDTVPYTYNVDYLQHVFKDADLLSQFDIWVELEIFGVPYAANQEISGCSGRSDVFFGTLDFITSTPAIDVEDNNVLIPLFFKHDFNNYQTGATDEIGKTEMTKEFWLEQDLTDAQFVLITSNHGSNSGGEEYKRRFHYIYFDGVLKMAKFKPGRTSCEPFRVYNTQGNGIYGNSEMSDAQWQSFSNWCPGDVIDNRVIKLGALTAGSHTFKIAVPDAKFAAKQGNFPLSLYLLGRTEGTIGVNETSAEHLATIYPNPASNILSINTSKTVKVVGIYSVTGKMILEGTGPQLNIQQLLPGIYAARIEFIDGTTATYKIIKN
jgi:hypothetical protein